MAGTAPAPGLAQRSSIAAGSRLRKPASEQNAGESGQAPQLVSAEARASLRERLLKR